MAREPLGILRDAFDRMVKDEAFRADAEKSHLMIDPMTSEQMEALLRRAYASPPAIVERAKDLLKRAAK